MIARGHYSREDAQRLVHKNIVTRALGVENEVQVDVIEDTVEVDDILLLCSDGLNDMVEAETIGFKLQRSDRQSVVEGKSVSVRVDMGDRRSNTKKTKHKQTQK